VSTDRVLAIAFIEAMGQPDRARWRHRIDGTFAIDRRTARSPAGCRSCARGKSWACQRDGALLLLRKLSIAEKVCANHQSLKTRKPWNGTKTRADVRDRSSCRRDAESVRLLCKAEIRGSVVHSSRQKSGFQISKKLCGILEPICLRFAYYLIGKWLGCAAPVLGRSLMDRHAFAGIAVRVLGTK
jgi:hypothetical protein